MRPVFPALAASTVLAVACGQDPVSSINLDYRPAFVVSDGANDGNAHFFFLPPMVTNPSPGKNDATLDPVVVICEWDGVCLETLATFTTDRSTTTRTHPGNSETIRVNGTHANVEWHSRRFGLDPALTYRICVKVGDVELGFADVDVVESGDELQDVPADFVGLLNGRTLPIKFRIEEGALEEPTVSGCQGQPT